MNIIIEDGDEIDGENSDEDIGKNHVGGNDVHGFCEWDSNYMSKIAGADMW